MKLHHWLTAGLAMSVAVGCSANTTTTTTVTPATTETASAIAAAEAAGAAQHPKASLHLKLARDQADEAKQLMRKDDDRSQEASLILARARADAELALLLARKNEAQRNAERAQQQVENLSRDN